MFTASCDYCGTGTGTNTIVEGDIYFTAVAVNGNTPSIFRIATDGKNMRQVISNGRIYSAPSKDKKIVFISEYIPGVKHLFISRIDGQNVTSLMDDNFAKDKLYPIISSDGKYIALNDIRYGLWLIKNETEVYQLTNNLCQNTIPSFSPDGTKLAFYDGGYLFNPQTIFVYDLTQNPPAICAKKQHSTGLYQMKGEAMINWSYDSKYVSYSISESEEVDIVYIGEYNKNEDIGYEITSIGAYNPILNKEMNKIVFSARDGNLWMRSLADTGKKYWNLTNSSKVYNVYPQWSSDGKKLLYSKYYKDDLEDNHAAMELIDFNNNNEIRVLSNNVNRGFWNY